MSGKRSFSTHTHIYILYIYIYIYIYIDIYIDIYIYIHTHTHTMQYCSAIKRNEFESVLVRWMNIEPVIQNKVCQKGKNKYCILVHMYGI